MGEVIPIHSRRTFSREEAEHLLPVVRRITVQAAEELDALKEELRYVPHDQPLFARLSAQVELAVRRWAIKVSRLGCEARGIWLVDFDAGDGCFSWRLGDEQLAFFHHAGEASPERPRLPHPGEGPA
jgi:Uncharacterized conserved protein (DUF2203)